MKRYEIWMAKVRFEGSSTIKTRPVMVWGKTSFIASYKMTGTDRGENSREFRVEYWKEAGLSKPTSIRISHLLKMQESDFVRKIGELEPRDRLRFEMRIASWR